MASDHLIQTIDGISFPMREFADFSFLASYGRVFKVFPDHDSGNISFGVDDGVRKRFIKVAGTRPMLAETPPHQAIATLRRVSCLLSAIDHPNVVKLEEAIEPDELVALVFDWAEGDVLRRANATTFARFRSLTLNERLAAFDDVLNVFRRIHEVGYVACDMYDATFQYDFDRNHVWAFDLDECQPKPFRNTMGRMYGSTRFMSPEEFQRGAPIDEITNVYSVGALSFLFFGDERDRCSGLWDAGVARFEVAARATRDDRNERFPSLASFADAWFRAGIDQAS